MDNCSGNTRYTGYKCNGSGSCNVSSGDIGCCAHSKCTVNGYPFCQYYNAGDENAKASPANDGDVQSGYVELASRYVCAPAKYLNRGTEAVSWDLGSLNTYYNRHQTYMSDANWWKFTGDGMVTAETSVTPSDTDLCFVYNYDPCTLSSDSDVVIRKTDGTLVDLGDIKQGQPITSGCSSNWIWIDLGSHVGIDPGILKIVLFSGNDDFVREWQFGWKKSETGNVTDGTNSTWCCDQSTDCVDDAPSQGNHVSGDPDSVCYNTGSTRDVDNDGDVDVCSSGSWIDCTSDSHCKNNFKCSASTCYSSCSSNSQCASGYYCSGSACVATLANGLACDENSDCASGNCRKEIDSSNYYCAASGNLCSEGGAGNAGYAAGAVGTNNNASWMCSSQDVSYQCTLANTCKTYNSKYCNGAGVWNSGTGLNVSTTGCNSYTCDSRDIMQDVCNGSGSCSQQGKFIKDCNNNESNRCVNGQSTCQNLCSNSVDDDGDGYKDGQDTDCGGCSQCTSGTCCNATTGCYLSFGTTCRASAGVCDPEEKCTGSSATCPSDVIYQSYQNIECRSAAGACDVAEYCAGSVNCPSNSYKPVGKQSCGTCQYCNGSSATCQLMASGSDTYNDCGTTGCYTGNCNGEGSCMTYFIGQRNCGTCKQCNGSGVCVDVTDNTDPYNSCGTCKVCSGGACINVTRGEDPKDECAFGNCGPGYCDEGACGYYYRGVEGGCPECQVCSGVDTTCINIDETLCGNISDMVYCPDGDNSLCGTKKPGEVCCVSTEYSTCFTGDTLIKTASGQDKKINELAIGDLIQGYNIGEERIKEVKITNVFKHEKQNYYSVAFKDGSVLKATKDHPLYAEKGYLKVEDLKVGDRIAKITGDKLEFIEIVKIKKSLFKKPVYNLEVDKYHNYFANNFLVHNKASVCNAAPDGAGTKIAYECGTCKVCSNGSCVNVSSGQDIDCFDFCSNEDCGKDYCDGGTCAYYTDLLQHNCLEGFRCSIEGVCEADPEYNTVSVFSGATSMISASENLLFSNYGEPLYISPLSPEVNFGVALVVGNQQGNVVIETDVTLAQNGYLIWGNPGKLILNGGKIILDGGTAVRAGSEIQWGWAGPLGQLSENRNEIGLRACICQITNIDDNYDKLAYGVPPKTQGAGNCSDITCPNPVPYTSLSSEPVVNHGDMHYVTRKIMPNGKFKNWVEREDVRYTYSGQRPNDQSGDWHKRIKNTSGPGHAVNYLDFFYPYSEGGYWKCSFLEGLFGFGWWESCTESYGESWCPGSELPNGKCPIYKKVWY